MLYTGTTYVRGERMVRPELCRQTERLGGCNAADKSLAVTVLVSGETWSGPLTDETRRYSRKATFIERVTRETGRHVHVINSAGYEALLNGEPARCYELVASP
ncbi:hypothetical protein [Cellulomonas xiejunii]|uniref:hypothetical protein n=1 Tax=Cellulomonas xiejunii TaxID=2968083 RepID=UPI001D0E843A|nr:hypothetical protein [Cellulomonas xiejunii]MCC2313468.1 hypothetical protein [Cellulomonas xiejunii]